MCDKTYCAHNMHGVTHKTAERVSLRTCRKDLSKFEETLAQQHEEKKMRRKAATHAD